jgi:hypothetical protein
MMLLRGRVPERLSRGSLGNPLPAVRSAPRLDPRPPSSTEVRMRLIGLAVVLAVSLFAGRSLARRSRCEPRA